MDLPSDLQIKRPHLRRASTGAGLDRVRWSIENIRAGFEYFYELNGRYPTTYEIDAFEFLPSSRSIQRSLGGLEHVRTVLGLKDTHFGKKEFRSRIATRINKRGREFELLIQKILYLRFGEMFVHTEKFFNSTKARLDFFVYCPGGNFGVDVFFTETIKLIQTNLSAKKRKYLTFEGELFFVVPNEHFSQAELDICVAAMKMPLPKEAKLVVLDTFQNIIAAKEFYQSPTTKGVALKKVNR